MPSDKGCVKIAKQIVWCFLLAGPALGALCGTADGRAMNRTLGFADESEAKGQARSKAETEKRPVTVADAIRMARRA